MRIAGHVHDYTGRQVVIETADGRELKRPGGLVVEIESQWLPAHTAADERFAQRRFPEALDEYGKAIRKEERHWVRRMILGRMIVCHRELGRLDSAGKLFLALVRDDPDTPYFDAIPLSWLAGEPSPALEQAAREWLDAQGPAVAVLLGASHLLSTADWSKALERLETLAAEKDPRIAALAQAQIWRTRSIKAGAEQLARWSASVERFPEPLRAGPYLVLNRALAQRGQSESAALAALHVALLYPHERRLSAEALWDAAQSLEKIGHAAGAVHILQEILTGYPETRAAAGARDRLEELKIDEKPAPAPTPTGDSLDERFLDGLRRRGLFELAETWCRKQLDALDAESPRRVELTIELSRNYTEHALQSPQGERDSLWRQALGVLADFAREYPGCPKLVLIQVQSGLVLLVRGELARQEAEAVGGGEARLEPARDDLRAAIAELQASREAIAVLLRRASPARRTEEGPLTIDELGALERNVSFQLARVFRNQGRSYPAGSADRTNSLRQAVELLSPLARSDDADTVAWQSRLDEVACDRLLEDPAAAKLHLAQLAERDPPPAVALCARAEEIRLALDRGQLDEAMAVADEGRTIAGEHSAELDFAMLEALVTAWKAASKNDEGERASDCQSRAVELVRDIDSLHGPYWSRRAETLLAGGVSAMGGADDLTLLMRAAESFYRSGEIDEALTTYDRLAEQAAAAKQADQAFEAGYTAAAIEQERGHHAEAAQRFRRLALSTPHHPKAGEAHLLALYDTSQAAKTDPVTSDEYRSLLEEHLANWPEATSASQVRVWLGRLHEREHRWADAIAAYQGVSPDHPQYADTIKATLRSFRSDLAQQAAAGRTVTKAAGEAARYFERLVSGAKGKLPERWSQAERLAATSAAELWLAYTNDHFDKAERILTAALDDSDDAPDDWRSTAAGLLVFAVAGLGRRDEAARLLEDLAESSPEQLLLLVEGLDRMAAGSTAAVRRELAELELRAADLLSARRAGLDEAARKQLDLTLVDAMAATGRRVEALSAAGKLAREFPRDGRIQETHAQLLLDGEAESDWRAALEQWRAIETKCKRGGERWFRSIYS
ncbi:MAG TPA: tetratricopeptide repeat protein, partial [Pirellulales bacterium]|nr:tetratricopeptide repeat protein [Pirellulales bacterium]